jgi:hypothetical protein
MLSEANGIPLQPCLRLNRLQYFHRMLPHGTLILGVGRGSLPMGAQRPRISVPRGIVAWMY